MVVTPRTGAPVQSSPLRSGTEWGGWEVHPEVELVVEEDVPVGPAEGVARRVPPRTPQPATGPSSLVVAHTVVGAAEVVLEEGPPRWSWRVRTTTLGTVRFVESYPDPSQRTQSP